MVLDHAGLLQLVHKGLVAFLKRADDVKLHTVAIRLLHPPCGGKQLVHALFVHDAPDKEEAHHPLLRVGLTGIIF